MISIKDLTGLASHLSAANPHNVDVPTMASPSEVLAGENTTKYVNPANLAAYVTQKTNGSISKHYQQMTFDYNAKIKTTDTYMPSETFYLASVALDFDLFSHHLNQQWRPFRTANIKDHGDPLRYTDLRQTLVNGKIGLWNWTSQGGPHRVEPGTEAKLEVNNSTNLGHEVVNDYRPTKGGIGLTTDSIPLNDPMVDEIYLYDTYEFIIQISDYFSPGNVNDDVSDPFGEPLGLNSVHQFGALARLGHGFDANNLWQSNFGRWTTRIQQQLGINVTTPKNNSSQRSRVGLTISVKNARSQKIVRTYVINLAIQVHA